MPRALIPHNHEHQKNVGCQDSWMGKVDDEESYNKHPGHPSSVKRKRLYERNAPVGEIMVAEENAREDHHWQGDHVDQSRSDPRIGRTCRYQDGNAAEGDVAGQEDHDQGGDASLDPDPEINDRKNIKDHCLDDGQRQAGREV